ncbi:hypothetical protein TOPH_00276, partial [Tolypocladium ophioglossoides CBS 100239]
MSSNQAAATLACLDRPVWSCGRRIEGARAATCICISSAAIRAVRWVTLQQAEPKSARLVSSSVRRGGETFKARLGRTARLPTSPTERGARPNRRLLHAVHRLLLVARRRETVESSRSRRGDACRLQGKFRFREQVLGFWGHVQGLTLLDRASFSAEPGRRMLVQRDVVAALDPRMRGRHGLGLLVCCPLMPSPPRQARRPKPALCPRRTMHYA